MAALGQAGTTVRGAYDVLVSMCSDYVLLPYLFLFAAMIRLQREPAGQEVRRVPGGKPVAILLGLVGIAEHLGNDCAVGDPRCRRDQTSRLL